MQSYLGTKPTVPRENNRLMEEQVNRYSDSPDEVLIKHLEDRGVLVATPERLPEAMKMKTGFPKYNQTELRTIPLDKVHYTQPSVNKGKLAHFAEHYHPDVTDFHPEDGVLSKWEAPGVNAYPDGTYTTADHHRLIAAKLRGDTHAIARVATWGIDPRNSDKLRVVKTKKEKFPAKKGDQ